MSALHFTRRGLLVASGGLALAGCDRIVQSGATRDIMSFGEHLTYKWQRLIGASAMAREFPREMISPVFKANGSINPTTEEYVRHRDTGFADWRLKVDGLVEQPLALGLADLMRMPSRTQITRHDCVEGWSAIGEWTGVQLARVLTAARLKPEARFILFHCMDNLDGEPGKGGIQSPGQYYESIDLVDAFHPQTILAYRLNGQPLDVGHGAPLRARIERQLGYKQAKYLGRIEAVSSLAGFGMGKGGYWEDRGYEWFAGI